MNDTRPTHYAHAHQGNIKVQIFTAYQFDACHYISILGENPSEEVDDNDDEIDNYYYCIMNKSQETSFSRASEIDLYIYYQNNLCKPLCEKYKFIMHISNAETQLLKLHLIVT